ncbi:TetR family transcriptional regulator [Gemmatimonadetes bacterium T265]|nr:TetR family transcriptional regulator [Gemmatimonadetes bacterium T265]
MHGAKHDTNTLHAAADVDIRGDAERADDEPHAAAPGGETLGDVGTDVRARIVAAAAALIAAGGREALTTRAVAAAAGVQAPTLYRLFGDKQGLVDAVAEHGFTTYLQQKRTGDPDGDPVEDLRVGWDLHVGFGLAHPALFAAMYGDPRLGDQHSGGASPAAARALAMLQRRMRVLALAGRLRVDERRAADLVRAAACGVVFILLETPEADRDLGLSAATCEAILAAITTDAPAPERPALAPVATTLRALLPGVPPGADGLTNGERLLLAEWLDRLVRSAAS